MDTTVFSHSQSIEYSNMLSSYQLRSFFLHLHSIHKLFMDSLIVVILCQFENFNKVNSFCLISWKDFLWIIETICLVSNSEWNVSYRFSKIRLKSAQESSWNKVHFFSVFNLLWQVQMHEEGWWIENRWNFLV